MSEPDAGFSRGRRREQAMNSGSEASKMTVPRDIRNVRDLDAIVDALSDHEHVESFKLNPECRGHTTSIIVRVTGLAPSTNDLNDICDRYDLHGVWASVHPTADLTVALEPTAWGEEDA